MTSAQQSIRFDRYAEAHVQPKGPGDARPTALQIIHDEHLEGKLADKVILVTGGSSGIGIETIRALAYTGAHVVTGVRDMKKGQTAIDEILKNDNAVKAEQLELLEMDLNSLASMRTAAASFSSKHNKLNILVNNAGIGGVKESKTDDGFESHMGVNHLAHFLLSALLRPLLVSSSTLDFNSRIINVSSSIHRFGSPDLSDLNWTTTKYNAAAAYAGSKTANIWFTNEAERRYGAQGLHSISLHPGGIMTGLQRFHAPEFLAMFEGVVKANPELVTTFKSLEQGAATTVLAAAGKEFEGKGGIYLDDCAVAPLWDPEKDKIYGPGYSGHAFDEDGEKKLWKLSCELVGIKDERVPFSLVPQDGCG